MPGTTDKSYRRAPADVRRISEGFRASTVGIDGALLRARIADLAARELPEGPEGRHTAGYVSAITEVATASPDASNVREFAKAFVTRPAVYSRSRAGLTAIQFEAWLIETGGALYQQFVETVVDGQGDTFLAIFQGRLTPTDIDQLRVGVGPFAKFKPLAEAGAVDYDTATVLELSIFECTATGKPNVDDVLPKTTYDLEMSGAVSAPTSFESLLPRDRAGYDRIYEEGGVSRASARYLLGSEALEHATLQHGQLAAQDAHGITWVSETGETWVPDVDALDEAFTNVASVTLYESRGRAALRSFCGTWAVFTSDVLVEDETRASTIVVSRGRAFVVLRPIAEARDIVESAARLYATSPAEGDAFIEAALADYASEHGDTCVNESTVVQMVDEDAAGRPNRADRDHDVRVAIACRESEDSPTSPQSVALALIERLASLSEGSDSLRHDARFVRDDVAGGTLFVTTSLVSESGPSFTIAIDPFTREGHAAAPTLTARLVDTHGTGLGWRDCTAPVVAVTEHVETFLRTLDVDTVRQVFEKEDEPEDEPEDEEEDEPEDTKGTANPR